MRNALTKQFLDPMATILTMVVIIACISFQACRSSGGSMVKDAELSDQAGCALRSRRGDIVSNSDLAAFNDPVATLLLSSGACPKTLSEVQSKLRQVDTENCADNPTLGPAGTSIFTVSDRADLMHKTDFYRVVLARQCSNRRPYELLMSIAGLDGTATALNPSLIEVIGFGRNDGAFHFYELAGGQWTFFGRSSDFVASGYDCNGDGACLSRFAAQARCAACHVGGGLVMKEQNNPWLHWDAANTDRGPLAGAHQFVGQNRLILGRKSDVADRLENLVQGGNRDWIQQRIEVLKTRGTKELLRPLFCTMDIALAASTQDTGNSFAFDPMEFFGTPFSNGISTPISFSTQDYSARILQNNQVIIDSFTGSAMTNADGLVRDTTPRLAFPKKSPQDYQYVAALLALGILDEQFVSSVLRVDFTRPVFSKTRCDLLDAAPDLPADHLQIDAIRKGFQDNLRNATGPGKLLLQSLSDPSAKLHADQEFSGFIGACAARTRADLLRDIVIEASRRRNAMRRAKTSLGEGAGTAGILEFRETLPVDDISDAGQSFDPKTCELQ